jgi:hypothetical protein
MVRRGIQEREIVQAIQHEHWQPAEQGRIERFADFHYGSDWNGRYYETKRVRPIFVEEAHEIVVVTVYSYYF